jgi:hypothetical protein
MFGRLSVRNSASTSAILTGLTLFFSLASGKGRPLPLASRVFPSHSLVILQFGAAVHTREVSKRVTNGSRTAVLDVIAFLCVSLGGSMRMFSGLVSVVKMATVLEDSTTEEQRTAVRFCGRKDSM